MWLFVAGGAPMLVIVVFGLVAVAAAAHFAWAPRLQRLAYVAALCVAVFFASLSGVCAGLMAVSVKVPANPEWAQSPDLPLILLIGFGESLAPAILGFSILAVVALISAVGLRRIGSEIAGPVRAAA